MMEIKTTKIIVAVLFGAIRVGFGILPLKLYCYLKKWEGDDGSNTFINQKRHNQVNLVLAMCQSFGGGVLFATCFLHVMLEVYNSVEEIKQVNQLHTEYPLSQLFVSIGFFFVYFMEELSHWFIVTFPGNLHIPVKKQINIYTCATVTPSNENKMPISIEKEYIKETNEVKEDSEDMKNDQTEVTKDVNYDSLSLNSEVLRENEKNLEKNGQIIENSIEFQQNIDGVDELRQKSIRCMLAVVALSLHATIEGLAIGLQKNESEIWYMFIATSIHSAIMMFCIGVELLLAKAEFKVILSIVLTLAVGNPTGVILGLLVTVRSKVDTMCKSVAVVLLEGLCAGTILYITFFEILKREKERRVHRILRSCCIIAGFTLMALLQALGK